MCNTNCPNCNKFCPSCGQPVKQSNTPGIIGGSTLPNSYPFGTNPGVVLCQNTNLAGADTPVIEQPSAGELGQTNN